ncbi:hypothetical protein ACOMHN_062928 [Nucella lapillus]
MWSVQVGPPEACGLCRCDHKKHCLFPVNTDTLGNPCPGVKLLTVEFDCCTSGRVWHGTACENETLDLTCGKGSVVHVQRASLCECDPPTPSSSNSSVNVTETCSDEATTAIVSTLCAHKRQCWIPVTQQVFGDLCPDDHKILEVWFTCKKIKVTCFSVSSWGHGRYKRDIRT